MADSQEVVETARFAKPEGLIGAFGVVRLWPGINNAEVEVIERLKLAARKLGLTCVEISPNGCRADSPNVRVTHEDLDFVLHLHYETPKAYDIFSFVALWNPLRFYYDYREGAYRKFSDHLLSHDDFLSCDSPGADDHVRRMILRDPSRLPPAFTLFHSLAEPILPPSLGAMKLFYVGINWERLGRQKSRHQELLDRLDKSGDLRIYGPDVFLGVKVWAGFKSYIGEIPFDGVSIVQEIAAAGISLVLSSEAHKESALMSSRLFESLAAGAVIICDENPFARKHFGDTLLYIDTTTTPEETHQQIREHLRWIKANQHEAVAMAARAQALFRAKFTMDRSLAELYTGFPERRETLARLKKPEATPPVTLFLMLPSYDAATLQRHIDSVSTQTYPNLTCVLLVDGFTQEKLGARIQKQLRECRVPVELLRVDFGPRDRRGRFGKRLRFGLVVQELLRALPPDALFCIVGEREQLFADHVTTLVKTLAGSTAASACAFSVLRTDNTGTDSYEVQDGVDVFGHVPGAPFGAARFLIRRPANDEELACVLPWLDSKALALLVAQADCVLTRRATLLHVVDSAAERKEAAAAGFEDEIMRDFLPSARCAGAGAIRSRKTSASVDPLSLLSISDMPNDKRRMILRELFVALPMPTLVRRGILWAYRQMRRLAPPY